MPFEQCSKKLHNWYVMASLRGICEKTEYQSWFWQKPLCNDMWEKKLCQFKTENWAPYGHNLQNSIFLLPLPSASDVVSSSWRHGKN